MPGVFEEYRQRRVERLSMVNQLGREDVLSMFGGFDIGGREADYDIDGSVATIRINGLLMFGSSDFEQILFGDWCPTHLASVIGEIENNDAIATVVMEFDCCGGTTAGMAELADAMRSLRSAKRIIAISRENMHSAGYWLASFAHEIVGTATSRGGSIGARMGMTLLDESEHLAREGVRAVHKASGELKATGAPGMPITPQQEQALQEEINASYEMFVEDVIENRPGLSRESIDAMQGGHYFAKRCVELGLFDRVVSYQGLMAELRETSVNPAANGGGAHQRSMNAMPGTNTSDAPTPSPATGNETLNLTAEEFEKQHPEEAKKLKQMGYDEAKSEMEEDDPKNEEEEEEEDGGGATVNQIEKLVAKDMDGRDGFILNCLKEGLTAYQVLERQVVEMSNQIAEFKANAPQQLVGGGGGADPVSTGGGGGGSAGGIKNAVQTIMNEAKAEGRVIDQNLALAKAAKDSRFSKVHREWVNQGCPDIAA